MTSLFSQIGIQRLFWEKEKNVNKNAGQSGNKPENDDLKNNMIGYENYNGQNIINMKQSKIVLSSKKKEDKLHRACRGATTIAIKCAFIFVIINNPKNNFIELMVKLDEVLIKYDLLENLRNFINCHQLPFFQCVKAIRSFKKNEEIFNNYVLEMEHAKKDNMVTNFTPSKFSNKMVNKWTPYELNQFCRLSSFISNIQYQIRLVSDQALKEMEKLCINGEQIVNYDDKQLLTLSQKCNIRYFNLIIVVNHICILYNINSKISNNNNDNNKMSNDGLSGSNCRADDDDDDDDDSNDAGNSDDQKAIFYKETPPPQKKISNKDNFGGLGLDSLRVVDLKRELKKRGLSQYGLKDELKTRLAAALLIDHN